MKKLRVTVNGVTYEVDVEVIADDEAPGMAYGYGATNVYSQPPAGSSEPPAAPPTVSPSAPPAGGEVDSKTLTSPLPGVVKEVKVKVGDQVKENDPVVIIEAMKMETVISSPVEGKVQDVKVSPSQSVQQGEVLVTFA